MKLKIIAIARHRNGVAGSPFDVVLFKERGRGGSLKVGILFDEPAHCAILDVAMLAAGDIAFASNSWRGDDYEPFLRPAIRNDHPPKQLSMTCIETSCPTAHHTTEPWRYGCTPHAGNGLPHKVFVDGEEVASCGKQANARRICAAVNACKSLDTEALEQGIVGELLDVLQGCLFALDKNLDGGGPSRIQAIAAATAAIAKASSERRPL